jgi:hypothetical protein
MADIALDSIIRFAYEVIVTMVAFNIFILIRFLPHFFGVYTFEIAPTLDNMV